MNDTKLKVRGYVPMYIDFN